MNLDLIACADPIACVGFKANGELMAGVAGVDPTTCADLMAADNL